jgi:hypothetical protein
MTEPGQVERQIARAVVMGYFRHPEVHGTSTHETCGFTWHDHGWIDSHDVGGDGITVCPSTTGPFPGQTACLASRRVVGREHQEDVDH